MDSIVKYYASLYTYPFMRDAGAGWSTYRMNGYIPLNYVIDTAGVVVGSMEGFDESTIRAWIESVLPQTGTEDGKGRPVAFESAIPNPASRVSTVRFSLARQGDVTLSVFSSTGALLRTIKSSNMPAGAQSIVWDLRDNAGRDVPNGLYLYELSSGTGRARMKVSVLK